MMNVYGYLYKITNNLNGMIYIGQKRGKPEKSKMYYGSEIWIKRSINKHGKENFKKDVLCKCYTKESLNKKEIFYIDLYRKMNYLLYNIADGGLGNGGKYGEDNPFYGKKHSKETKEMWSKKRKGMMSGSMNPNYGGKNLVGKQNPFYGKKHTDETKKLLNKKLSGKNNYNYGKRGPKHCPWCRTILQINKKTDEIIKVHYSVKEAGESIGKPSKDLSRCLTGKRKTAHGFKWKYAPRYL